MIRTTPPDVERDMDTTEPTNRDETMRQSTGTLMRAWLRTKGLTWTLVQLMRAWWKERVGR